MTHSVLEIPLGIHFWITNKSFVVTCTYYLHYIQKFFLTIIWECKVTNKGSCLLLYYRIHVVQMRNMAPLRLLWAHKVFFFLKDACWIHETDYCCMLQHMPYYCGILLPEAWLLGKNAVPQWVHTDLLITLRCSQGWGGALDEQTRPNISHSLNCYITLLASLLK